MGRLDIVQQRKMEGLRIFFNTLEYRTPHFHDSIEIIWVMEGRLLVYSEGDTLTLNEGETLIFNMNRLHEYKKLDDEGCTMLAYQIGPSFLEKEVEDIRDVHFDAHALKYLPGELKEKIEYDLFQVAYQYIASLPYYELYCKSKIQEVIYELLLNGSYQKISAEESIRTKSQNARFQRLMQFVDQNYMKKIRLIDFAESENLSLSSVGHLMKKEINMNFQEYVNYIRFNAAYKLMLTTKYNMTDICIESGFSDYRYFVNTFIQYTGMTPKEYSSRIQAMVGDETQMHHSIHSRERFYNSEQSIALLEKYKERYIKGC